MILAGTPAIITLSGNTPLTIEPAATTHPEPKKDPSRNVVFAPIQQ